MSTRVLRAAPWIAVFALAFGYRVYLIVEFPPVYWWDAFARIWESDHLVVRHWLPLPQVPVMLIDDVVVLRCAFAFFAGVAVVALGVAVTRIWSLRHGLTFACLIALMPLFVKWSTVPYQESMLLAFLALALVAFPRGLADAPGWGPWLGAAALAAAVLCRYEAWVFAFALAGFTAIRREWRALRFLIPAAVIMVVWVATASLRDPMMGPPRLGEPPEGLGTLSFGELYHVAKDTAFLFAKKVDKHMPPYASWLLLWGLVVTVVKARRGDRELALFALALFALGTLRAANAQRLTSRMLVFPLIFASLYTVVGWFDLWRRGEKLLEPKLGGRRFVEHIPTAVALAVTVALTFHFARGYKNKARKIAYHTARELRPELELAETLAEMPDLSVAIFPRKTRNILRESAVAAIFAQDPSLDPLDARFTYEGKDPDAPVAVPEAMVRWRKGRYEIVEAPEVLKDQVRGHLESVDAN